MVDLRDYLIESLKREHIGPDPSPNKENLQENGEEILKINPIKRYSTGILYPQEIDEELVEDLDKDEKEVLINDIEDIEEVINQTNKFQQSAFAISFMIEKNQPFEVIVNGAFYTTKKQESFNDFTLYHRNPVSFIESIQSKEWEQILGNHYIKELNFKDESSGLEIRVFKRYEIENSVYLTASLENKNGIKTEYKGLRGTFFQSELILETKKGFLEIPNYEKKTLEEDILINEMLYRNQKLFALGHGVSINWNQSELKINKISSTFIPRYEIKPILPSRFENLNLSMKLFSDVEQKNEAMQSLRKLIDEYNAWLEEIKSKSLDLDEKHIIASKINIENITLAKNRMMAGLKILIEDKIAYSAFRLMNQAMLRQQLRYALPLSRWKKSDNNEIFLETKFDNLPEINDENTWYDKENKIYGQWRPFQIAFILLNIVSMVDKFSDDRKILDLIWFPTGGGKTEAYLGLSAFSIFLRRLKNKNDSGTDVIMRYTLRLLTTQQFERAASLIIACDHIRSLNSNKLGQEPISIGLWVGGGTTPNKISDAVKTFDELYRNQTSDNPFKVVKCPNCGAQMGPLNFENTPPVKGYYKSKKGIKFVCANNKFNCEYSNPKMPLPIYVVDEEIYSSTPTLVLGTVDKFANIPFIPDSIRLFGNSTEGIINDAPNLIIQDELHLISGPLGSTVGHYETIIDYFVTRLLDGKEIKPKYIASTATISRAKKQCNSLYACGEENVYQFPPQGINEGDSFFAYKDTNNTGRLYVGLMISGKNSKTTGTIRTYSRLLYIANELKNQNFDVDAYWTNVAYFNNIRQLGQVVNWVNQDVQEYLNSIYTRERENIVLGELDNNSRRYLRRYIELTSRINSTSVSENLHKLEISKLEDPENVIDIALATNMISVGLDVSRLGLMTINGQPKSTSEYIQATSRVGRDFKNHPGLVVVLYDSSRSRDRSHFENFQHYHSRIYANVEPTSVTSFSSPLVKRFLHAIVISILRLSPNFTVPNDIPKPPNQDDFEKISKVIRDRINKIDPSLFKNAEEVLISIFKKWHQGNHTAYIIHNTNIDGTPLMYPSNVLPNKSWEDHSFSTPNSMRSVDQLSQVDIIVGDEHYGY